MADIIGLGNNQIPLCGDLGQLAFQDNVKCKFGTFENVQSKYLRTYELHGTTAKFSSFQCNDYAENQSTFQTSMTLETGGLYHYASRDLTFQKRGGTSYDMIFQNYYSWSSNEYYARFYGNSGCYLYYNGSTKFYTTSSGVKVTGTMDADAIFLGDSEPMQLGNSNDYAIKFDGANNRLLIDNQQNTAFCQINNQLSTGIWEQVWVFNDTSGTVAVDAENSSVFYANGGNLTGDLTINLRYNSSLSWASGTVDPNHHSFTVAVIVTNGATAYKVANFQIDGVNQTVLYQGGTTPVGNANSVDVYTFTVVDVSGNYTILGSQSQYA
jgi:hypothetical protein